MEHETPVYRCQECRGLSEDEPLLVVVREWDGTFGQWVDRKYRICTACVSRTKSAYRRREGGFHAFD